MVEAEDVVLISSDDDHARSVGEADDEHVHFAEKATSSDASEHELIIDETNAEENDNDDDIRPNY